jgi:hypothetical protein
MISQSQKEKRLLEGELNRIFSDATWYRIRKQLQAIGVNENDFTLAFKLIGGMNRGRKDGGKIALIPYDFIDVWKALKININLSVSEKVFTCNDFITFITRNQNFIPKDRYKDGKKIGVNTIWYRWFSSCGLKYSANQKYKLSDLFPIIAFYYAWKYKQTKKIDLPIIDVEIAS